MRFHHLCGLLVLSSLGPVAAQGPYWAKALGGLGADQVADVKADASGALYFTGEYGAPFAGLGWNGGTDILVGKLDAAGQVLWMRGAGGSDIDRGLKLCPTNDGDVVVVGQFMGTVDLFGITVTSQGGSQDVFTAKLAGATGQAQWVRTGGSALFSDRPYGVTVAPNGQVTVAGDFKGEAAFGAQTLSSMIDPSIAEASFDVFIASYSAGGDLLWLLQGAAPHTDRAIDVVSDASSAIYVTGQFSDTITFATAHPNTIAGATFLLKLDAQGNEQWFRRCGGASFSQVRDMALTSGGDLLLCGELQGTLVYEDADVHLITAADPYACYVLRVADDGQWQADTVLGSINPLSVAAIVAHGDSLAVLGAFECQHTGLSARYGSGLFMATGMEDLFIAKYDLQDLSFRNAQQFGGGLGKFAGQLTALDNGGLVFCGGFEQQFILPSDATNWAGTDALGSVNGAMAYCGDPNYGRFRGITSSALTDGFIARGVVPGRRPYDFWKRQPGGGCITDPVVPCVVHGAYDGTCPDEIRFCTPFPLLPPQLDMAGAALSAGSVGPTLSVQWSMGSTGITQDVNGVGTYGCTASAVNGCWSWNDAAEVVYDAYPQPLLNDANGQFVDLLITPPPSTYGMLLCGGSDVLTLGGLSGGDQAVWQPEGVATITVSGAGSHAIEVTAANGCSFGSAFIVQPSGSVAVPNITGLDAIFHLASGAPFDGTDTNTVCGGSLNCVGGSIDLQWYIDGAPSDLPAGIEVLSYTECGVIHSPPEPPSWTVFPVSEGTYPIDVTIRLSAGPCVGDTLAFDLSSEVYVAFLDAPIFEPQAPLIICPGDTLAIPLNCTGCDQVQWDGPGIVGLSPALDTAYVVDQGYYVVLAANTAGGAYCPGSTSFFVDPPYGPPLFTDPADGIVCPGQPAWIYTDMAGSGFEWLGPSGPIPTDNDSIQVSEFGDYYLTMTNAQGCEVSNGPIELSAYGTPYLNIPAGDEVLCPGEPVTVEVVAPGATAIQWQAPLSGSDPVQVIDQPGAYTCSITSCGITTFAHITLVDGSISAELADPGPYALCNGRSVTLHGPDGGASYLWLPVQEPTQDLVVSGQGAYQLVITSPLGCVDTSSYIDVVQQTITQPVQADDVAVCPGTDADLHASGSGMLTWYEDAGLATIIGTGATLSLPAPTVADTVYIVQEENGCTGTPEPVIVSMLPVPPLPVIAGDTAVCVGDAWSLTVNSAPGETVVWQTPQGAVEGDPLSYASADPVQSGLYTVAVEAGGCTSGAASLQIAIMPCDVVVPNIFTPNGDGRNDMIVLESPSDRPMEMRLFNRWGQVVFTRAARVITLDGYNGTSGEVLPAGVYYYELRIGRDDGSDGVLSGYIQLVR